MDANVEEGDIVQITNENHPWYGCLMVVEEPKTWGFQGFIQWPVDNKAKSNHATAYNRPKKEDYEIVGHCALTPA